jgi:hypothetical protein
MRFRFQFGLGKLFIETRLTSYDVAFCFVGRIALLPSSLIHFKPQRPEPCTVSWFRGWPVMEHDASPHSSEPASRALQNRQPGIALTANEAGSHRSTPGRLEASHRVHLGFRHPKSPSASTPRSRTHKRRCHGIPILRAPPGRHCRSALQAAVERS